MALNIWLRVSYKSEGDETRRGTTDFPLDFRGSMALEIFERVIPIPSLQRGSSAVEKAS
jgi:hypothetical protein